MLSVFFRAARAQAFSIESLFSTILQFLPTSIGYRSLYVPESRVKPGSILRNIYFAYRNKTAVNHITGDIHYIALGLPPRRTILTIHDLRPLERGSWLKRRLIKLWWFSLPVRWVKYVTVISEATRQELLKHLAVNPAKIKVIPNCLSPEFRFVPKEFNSGQPRILHLGTKENKNLERLIVALRDLPVELRIIGTLSAEQRALLKANQLTYSAQANLSPREVVNEYAEADMVSFVSLYEGFGMPIIEAQATGRPVLSSNCSSMPEVAGNSALLVDPNNTEEIRKGILRIIGDASLRSTLIAQGRENIKRFTPEKVANQYADLYRQLVEEAQ